MDILLCIKTNIEFQREQGRMLPVPFLVMLFFGKSNSLSKQYFTDETERLGAICFCMLFESIWIFY